MRRTCFNKTDLVACVKCIDVDVDYDKRSYELHALLFKPHVYIVLQFPLSLHPFLTFLLPCIQTHANSLLRPFYTPSHALSPHLSPQ